MHSSCYFADLAHSGFKKWFSGKVCTIIFFTLLLIDNNPFVIDTVGRASAKSLIHCPSINMIEDIQLTIFIIHDLRF